MDYNYLFDEGKKANNLISDYLKENKVFSLCRLGWSECGWINHYIEGGIDCKVGNTTLRQMLRNGGIYGSCEEDFLLEYTNSISTADAQVFWIEKNGHHVIFKEQINVFGKYSRDSIKLGQEVLFPYLHTNFWTKSLKDKKVLIVYPFVDTINKQLLNREKIWTDEHGGKIPECQFITYKPVWSLNGVQPHGSWVESLNFMKEDISKIDFDVAILGCSHYGTPLVSFIRTVLNKTAIYMGGETQIFFGIKGKRWDQYPHVTKFYNKYWTRSIDEVPSGHFLMDGGCYW